MLINAIVESGFLDLFFISFISATLFPFASEGAVAIHILQGFNVFLVIFVATLGNYLGSITNYYIGLKGSNTIFHRIIKFDDKKTRDAERKFRKYGPAILLFSWLPVVGDPLTFVAGVLKYDFKKFTIYVFIGKAIRYYVIALITLGILAI